MNTQDDRTSAVPPYTHDYIEQDELQIICRRRRRLYPEATSGKTNTIGVALSGGGIRSAATNLGVLYEMSRVGLFKSVDYLSTVSGGGYIGCCLASLLSLSKPGRGEDCNEGKAIYTFTGQAVDESLFSADWNNFPFRDKPFRTVSSASPRPRLPEPTDKEFCDDFSSQSQIDHMRNRASYLMPRSLLFSTDTIRMLGATACTTLLPLLWFLSLVTMVSTLYMTATIPQWRHATEQAALAQATEWEQPTAGWRCRAIATSAPPTAKATDLTSLTSRSAEALTTIRTGISRQFGNFFDKEIFPGSHLWGVAVPFLLWGFAAQFLTGFWAKKVIKPPPPNEAEESYYFRRILRDAALVTGAIYLFLFTFVALYTFKVPTIALPDHRLLVLPWAALFCLLGSLLRYCFLIGRCEKDNLAEGSRCWSRFRRSETAMFTGLFLYTFAATLILALLPAVIVIGNSGYLFLLLALLTSAIRFFLARKKADAGNKKRTAYKAQIAKLSHGLMDMAVLFFILLAVIGVCCLLKDQLQKVLTETELMPSKNPFTTWLFFYLTYLIIPAAVATFLSLLNFNAVSPHIFYMDRLAEAFLHTYRAIRPEGHNGCSHSPLTIVAARNTMEMNLTDLHGTMAKMDRSDPASCAARGPYLLINATLNLTAVRDLKGFRRQSTDFLFSRCYTGSERTGYVPTTTYHNPSIMLRRAMAVSGAAITSVRGAGGNMAESFACTIFGVRLGYWLRHPKRMLENSGLAPWSPLNLFSELFRYTDSERNHIYLSDGGHCGDNLGIMPLFRRKVKLIIASDAECDPDHLFNSLNSSIRRAYVDLNIKITIDLDNLVPDANGRSKMHYVIGRIFYPERPWQKSWLLVIKNTMTGKESAPIRNYRTKSPDFPHESTADQFFTEEQFEVYRSLGREACQEIWSSCIGTFKGETWRRDPWSRIDEFCETLMHECYRKTQASEEVKAEPPWQKGNHCWDDIIRSIWRSELGSFSDWKGFRRTIRSQYREMKKDPTFQYRTEMENQLRELKVWLDRHRPLFPKLDRRYDVPRNWEQFNKVKNSLDA